jgi:Flp pilus assembly protein TadD
LELRLKQTDDAYDHLSQAAQLAPGNPVVMINYGAVLRTKGQFEEAEQVYLKAVSADPTRPEGYHNLAILYGDDMGRPQDAIKYFNLYIQYSQGKEDRNERVNKWINDLQTQK